jgi:hypothetical protein
MPHDGDTLNEGGGGRQRGIDDADGFRSDGAVLEEKDGL